MRILVNKSTEKILTKNGSAIARIPWGYYQAMQWNAVDLYNWIYSCFRDGFSRSESYYGDASEYMTGIQKLLIPLSDFSFKNTEMNKKLIANILLNVATDNPEFCYNVNMTLINETVYNGYTLEDDGTFFTNVWVYAPNDNLRNIARAKLLAAVNDAKEAVSLYCNGITTSSELSENQKRNVTKILHDWIMDKTHYAETINYWSKTAFSAIVNDSNDGVSGFPVCTGYAEALSYLCGLYGINAVYVEGQVGASQNSQPEIINHAWNMVSFILPYGKFDNDPSKWAAIDLTYDDGRQDNPEKDAYWKYFCTDSIYHSNGSIKQTRVNSSKGYPVDVPTKKYQYYGSILYGISEGDWGNGE